MVFDFSRSLPFPTIYPENKTPVTVDVLEVGWIVAFITLFFTYSVVTLVRPVEGLSSFIRTTISLFIGLIIMLCNFGHEWEVGHVRATTPYRAGIPDHIEADIGVKIGLRAVNITLKAPDKGQEKIDYNERFWWTWTQGRNGFGPFAGEIQQEFREHQRRGTPYPILWVAEYFTFDGEGIRFGRHYRHSGWYAHICIWTAFPLWILAHVTLLMVPVYGGLLLLLTGTFLLCAALIWVSYRNFIELAIPFSHGKENVLLETQFGVHWYLALCVGIACIVLGGMISLLARTSTFESYILNFFGINSLSFVEIQEEEATKVVEADNAMEMEEINQDNKAPTVMLSLRHRGSNIWRRQGRNRKEDDGNLPSERPPLLPYPAKVKQRLSNFRDKFNQKKLLNVPEEMVSQTNPSYKIDETYVNVEGESNEEAVYQNISQGPRAPALPPRKR
ncbi:dual oxidase maturation factor 1-like isoform X2 [Oratosquilla oratoria]|uniref:dual oxidase maturation factor 1-like isoform X2 n=1 Tax=Oratosquilla oratoria TaxID=337810 RepID=UPI003F75F5B7